MELQKDPELLDLRNQIKTLIDKQASLTLEKLRKINPEAAVIQQKLNERQEKMMAARRSQMEAMQAKFKAQQANSESQKENDAPAAKVVVP
jgi:ribosomal protein S3